MWRLQVFCWWTIWPICQKQGSCHLWFYKLLRISALIYDQRHSSLLVDCRPGRCLWGEILAIWKQKIKLHNCTVKLCIYLQPVKATLEVFKVIIRRTEENLKVKMVILRKVNGTQKNPSSLLSFPVGCWSFSKLGFFHWPVWAKLLFYFSAKTTWSKVKANT